MLLPSPDLTCPGAETRAETEEGMRRKSLDDQDKLR